MSNGRSRVLKGGEGDLVSFGVVCGEVRSGVTGVLFGLVVFVRVSGILMCGVSVMVGCVLLCVCDVWVLSRLECGCVSNG